MKTNQRGHYNIDLIPVIIVFGIVCVLVGVGLVWIFEWLWPIAKAWLHTVTA